MTLLWQNFATLKKNLDPYFFENEVIFLKVFNYKSEAKKKQTNKQTNFSFQCVAKNIEGLLKNFSSCLAYSSIWLNPP
jgi:hypothetical protein